MQKRRRSTRTWLETVLVCNSLETDRRCIKCIITGNFDPNLPLFITLILQLRIVDGSAFCIVVIRLSTCKLTVAHQIYRVCQTSIDIHAWIRQFPTRIAVGIGNEAGMQMRSECEGETGVLFGW